MFDVFVMFIMLVIIDKHVKRQFNEPMVGVRQFDEDAALDAVLGVFWQQGYGPTTMQDLAEASGVLRGSLYNAYGSKEALFLRAYARYTERYLAAVDAELAQPDVEQALRGFFNYLIDSMRKERRGCMTTKAAVDEQAGAKPIRRAVRELLAALEARLLVRLSQRDARSRLSIAPEAAAQLLVTLTRGIVVMERVHGDVASLRATAEAALAALLRPA